MLAVKLYILPGLLSAMGLVLGGLLLRGAQLRRHPVMFAQATVVALRGNTASFELFDGQILHLIVGKDAVLHVGDYGRLTYRAGRFLRLEYKEER